jgi:DNA-directed RNA polymerase subunit RPC12/RpoP
VKGLNIYSKIIRVMETTLSDQGTHYLRKEEPYSCLDCGGSIYYPESPLVNEIIPCPDCGMDYIAKSISEKGIEIEELLIEGEDWGQ